MKKLSLALRLAGSSLAIVASLAAGAGTAHAEETTDRLVELTQVRAMVVSEVRALGTTAGVTEQDLKLVVVKLAESERLLQAEAAATAQEAAAAAARDLAQREAAARAAARLPYVPVPSGTVSSPFGMRGTEMHEGIDFASAMYAPVVAAAAGTVTTAGHPYLAQGDAAAVVIIAHDATLSTLYGHLDDTVKRWTVKVGDRVEAGQVIGYVGMSGRSSGPHLHFMALERGVAVDPAPMFPAGSLR